MIKPSAIVLTGYGINCEEETKYAFEKAGARADIVHINDLIDGTRKLKDYQILAFPGGFSFGDDTGSGNAFANRIRNHMFDEVKGFVEKDHLVLGVCNGFQILANLGLLPAIDGKYGERQVALLHNKSARYQCEWVDVDIVPGKSPWVQGIGNISLPIAHGEGKFYADARTLDNIIQKGLIAATYVPGEMYVLHGRVNHNPNGSLDDIAGITDESGRVFGLMPHPERAIEATQLPHWTLRKEMYRRWERELPSEGPGIKIFRNGVDYFS